MRDWTPTFAVIQAKTSEPGVMLTIQPRKRSGFGNGVAWNRAKLQLNFNPEQKLSGHQAHRENESARNPCFHEILKNPKETWC